MSDARDFYDNLAEVYHLIFENWDASIARQAAALEPVVRRWVGAGGLIIDAAAGIGTQTIALGLRGFRLAGSDISRRAVTRAAQETRLRQLDIPFAVADLRALPFRPQSADVIIACDNALPHLLSLDEIKTALLELQRCVRPGGGVLISMRDYSVQPAGTRELRPYGERLWNGRRFHAEQEWLWQGATYRLTLRIRPLDAAAEPGIELETTYLAASIDAVLGIMREIGLDDVERVDDVYYQPLLVGTVPHDQ
jgi:SAM-dependent methyltransferase